MRRLKRLLLTIGCVISIAVCTVLYLQSQGVVPPLGVGWGDAVRASACDLKVDESIVIRTASGMKNPTVAGFAYGVRTLGHFDVAGIQYRRWEMILQKPDRTPLPGSLGRYMELRIAAEWPVLLSLATLALCLWRLAKERQRWMAGRSHLCQGCGYDLRATPDRCPECGLVPAGKSENVPPNLRSIPTEE